MQQHELKIQSEYYEAVEDGSKRFELRKNDRGYQVGDILTLCEHKNNEYAGRSTMVVVTYMLSGAVHGLEDGYVILSIKQLSMVDMLRGWAGNKQNLAIMPA